jgi:hypothetical protein
LACTLYTGVFDQYYDCAGFGDNRGGAQRVCASISTELAIKSAKSIKNIAIVLNWEILTKTKYKQLFVVAKTLTKLIPSFYTKEIVPSILFIINNNPKSRSCYTKKILLKKRWYLNKV